MSNPIETTETPTEQITPENRWQHGTVTPEEIPALIAKPHTAVEWKLINTITNLYSILEGQNARRNY